MKFEFTRLTRLFDGLGADKFSDVMKRKLALRAFDTEEDMRLACLAYLDGDVVVRTLKP